MPFSYCLKNHFMPTYMQYMGAFPPILSHFLFTVLQFNLYNFKVNWNTPSDICQGGSEERIRPRCRLPLSDRAQNTVRSPWNIHGRVHIFSVKDKWKSNKINDWVKHYVLPLVSARLHVGLFKLWIARALFNSQVHSARGNIQAWLCPYRKSFVLQFNTRILFVLWARISFIIHSRMRAPFKRKDGPARDSRN